LFVGGVGTVRCPFPHGVELALQPSPDWIGWFAGYKAINLRHCLFQHSVEIITVPNLR
jgi:hypothetical protein